MLKQSFRDFIFSTNTDGSGKAASYVRAVDMLGQGVAKKLIRIDDDGKRIEYLRHGISRDWTKPEAIIEAKAYLTLVLQYEYPDDRIQLFAPVTIGSSLREAELAKLDKRMEFAIGFDANLRNMRQFFLVFGKRYTLCSELNWSHYHHALRRTRIRLTYPSARLLSLSYFRLRNWLSTDLYEQEGNAQTNFAHCVCISSSMCDILGSADHAGLLKIGDEFFKSPKKVAEQTVNCAELKAA